MESLKALQTIKMTSNQSNNVDEQHTLHTKLLSVATCAVETDLNNVNKSDQSFCSLDDFTGGPIHNNQSSELHLKQYSCDQNTELNSSITTTPADSSGGFHNTFSVLECHLNKNKRPNQLSQQQIEYLLLHRKDIAIHNNIYIDIPIDDANKKSINDENFPSLFELELEAMDRLQTMWAKNQSDNVESLPVSSDLHLSLTQTVQNEPKPNEYIYHVARSRNGQLYLRVRRNSCLDQGI